TTLFYSFLSTHLSRRWLVRVVFHLAAASLVGFAIWIHFGSADSDEELSGWLAVILMIWINVYGLFATSVFWTVMTDLAAKSGGSQRFGRIAAGGTVGGIAGSFFISIVAAYVPLSVMLLIPAILIEVGLIFAWSIENQEKSLHQMPREPETLVLLQPSKPTNEKTKVDESSWWDGPLIILNRPYLIGICVFLFLYQSFGTIFYFQQASIVGEAYSEQVDRLQFFARVDFAVQACTLLLQTLVFARAFRMLGLAATLAAVPFACVILAATMAFFPTLISLAITMVCIRSFGYGLTTPAREVLFTMVPRAARYRSKNFIDTVLLRSADVIAASGMSVASKASIPMLGLNLAASVVAVGWTAIAWMLGREYRKKALDQTRQ
ncbi:MAG: MFS transporter, partial [Planctomycetota bacterium]